MTNRRISDIPLALDTTLSGASHDPALLHRVINASKGDAPPVKKKLTASFVTAILLILLTAGVALAAAHHGVVYFLTEKTCEPLPLDPEYLMNSLQQNHTSQRLSASIADAYWDGKTLSIAYHITPADASQTIILPCDTASHDHFRPIDDADILLEMPDFINITIGDKISRPLGDISNWVYEEDGSITIMHSFPLNSMNEAVGISIPLSSTRTSDGSEEFAMVHCSLPALPDPIAPHVHEWLPATCVSPMTCSICGRTEGGLGRHNFQPEACNVIRTCPICTYSYEAAHSIAPDNPTTCYCGALQELPQ